MNAPVKPTSSGFWSKRDRAQRLFDLERDLTPTQKNVLGELEAAVAASGVVAFGGDPGSGRTRLAKCYAQKHGGKYLGLRDYLDAVRHSPQTYATLNLLRVLRDELAHHDLVILDDYVEFLNPGFPNVHPLRDSTGHFHLAGFSDLLFKEATEAGKRLIVVGPRVTPRLSTWMSYRSRTVASVSIPELGPGDYAAFVGSVMGAKADGIDFKQVYRVASGINGHRLAIAAKMCSALDAPGTGDFLDIVDSYIASSNTRVQEVEEVTFEQMPGTEVIAETLDTHIVIPLTNHALAGELDLEPKRGVMLYGPPGTGKTSVGRALAHRMKGRFFLIDGSVNTEPNYEFFAKVEAIIEEARENTPCVLFIDDADILFGIAHAARFGRLLLSLLDGMESRTARNICVMMTAMDPRKVPAAVLRSGRVELWLETRLPDAAIRAGILERWNGGELPGSADVDYEQLAGLTAGFTPADLRRIHADARALFLADKVRGAEAGLAQDYLVRAIEAVIATRNEMAANLADDSLRLVTTTTEWKKMKDIGGG